VVVVVSGAVDVVDDGTTVVVVSMVLDVVLGNIVVDGRVVGGNVVTTGTVVEVVGGTSVVVDVVEVGGTSVVVDVVEVAGGSVVLVVVVSGQLGQPIGSVWSVTPFRQWSASRAVMRASPPRSQMHAGSHVYEPTAARKISKQSDAVGFAPGLPGWPQSPRAARASGGAATAAPIASAAAMAATRRETMAPA
jgi:hypothetical protein